MYQLPNSMREENGRLVVCSTVSTVSKPMPKAAVIDSANLDTARTNSECEKWTIRLTQVSDEEARGCLEIYRPIEEQSCISFEDDSVPTIEVIAALTNP
jgi:hypothetical protein